MRTRSFRSSASAGAVVAVAVAALAAGCSPASAVPGAESGAARGNPGALEKTSIVVDDFPTIDSAGLYIAQMDGLFRRQGLNVTIRFAPVGQLAVSSALGGTSDIASADYVTLIDDEVKAGDRLRIIAEASSLKPGDLSMLVGPRSDIRSLSGLKGRTVGVTSADDMATLLVSALLAENGIKPASVDIKFGFPLNNVAQELDDGLASAAPIPEPFASEGEQNYGLQVLDDVDQGATRNFPLEGFAVTRAWARKYPHTLAAFVTALRQGQQIADADRSQVEAAIGKFLGISPQTAAIIALPDYPLSVNATQLQRVVHTMLQFGLLGMRNSSFKITSMTG